MERENLLHQFSGAQKVSDSELAKINAIRRSLGFAGYDPGSVYDIGYRFGRSGSDSVFASIDGKRDTPAQIYLGRDALLRGFSFPWLDGVTSR
jgi:hypothetical protein